MNVIACHACFFIQARLLRVKADNQMMFRYSPYVKKQATM